MRKHGRQSKTKATEVPRFLPSECLERYLTMLRDKLTDEEEDIHHAVHDEVKILLERIEKFEDAASNLMGALSIPPLGPRDEEGRAEFPETLDANLQWLLREGHWDAANKSLLKIKELLESKNFRVRQISEVETAIADVKSKGM